MYPGDGEYNVPFSFHTLGTVLVRRFGGVSQGASPSGDCCKSVSAYSVLVRAKFDRNLIVCFVLRGDVTSNFFEKLYRSVQ
jgi:hypothetical protein